MTTRRSRLGFGGAQIARLARWLACAAAMSAPGACGGPGAAPPPAVGSPGGDTGGGPGNGDTGARQDGAGTRGGDAEGAADATTGGSADDAHPTDAGAGSGDTGNATGPDGGGGGDPDATWRTRTVQTTHADPTCRGTLVLPDPLEPDDLPLAAESPWFERRTDLEALLDGPLQPEPDQVTSVQVVRTATGFDLVLNIGYMAAAVWVAHATGDGEMQAPVKAPGLQSCIAQTDVNRDGWQDVVCADRVVLGSATGLDWSGASALPLPGPSDDLRPMMITAADVLPDGEGDGWPDLLIAEWAVANRAYRGSPSGFTDTYADLGLEKGPDPIGWGFALFDLDTDGRKEIYQMPDGGAQSFTYHWVDGALDWYGPDDDPLGLTCSTIAHLPTAPIIWLFNGPTFLHPMGLTISYDEGDTEIMTCGLATLPNFWVACHGGVCRHVESALGLASVDVPPCLCGNPPAPCPGTGPGGLCDEGLNPLGLGGKPRGANGTVMVGWVSLLRDVDGDGLEDVIELYGDDPGHRDTSPEDAAGIPPIFGDQSSRPVQAPVFRRARSDGTYEVWAGAGLDVTGAFTNGVWQHMGDRDLLFLGQTGGPLRIFEAVAPQRHPSFFLRLRGGDGNLTDGVGGRVRVHWPDGRRKWFAVGRIFEPRTQETAELKLSWRDFDRVTVEAHWQSGAVTTQVVGRLGAPGLPADAVTVPDGGELELSQH